MSTGSTIIFEPTKGYFKQAIKPYTSWRETSDMSPALEIDGEFYRLLRITGRVWKYEPNKLVVCKENGVIEKDEEITRKWIEFYFYIRSYKQYKRSLAFDASHGKAIRHEPRIASFQAIIHDLQAELSPEEMQAMEFHLYYLKEVYRISRLLSIEVKELMICKEELKKIGDGILSKELMDKVMRHFQKRYQLRGEIEAILLEDGEKARDIVLEILTDTTYRKKTRSKKHLDLVVREIHGATIASTRTLAYVKKQKKLENQTFLIHAYFAELRHQTIEEEVKPAVDHAMEEVWLYSKTFS